MRFLDTNLLIRYFTRDDEKKAQRVLKLLKRVERGEEKVITSPLVLFEIVFTPREKIKELLSPILELRGLKLSDKEIYRSALDIYAKKNLSFADAFNAAFALKKGIKEIYSYDEDLDKIEGIRRVVP